MKAGEAFERLVSFPGLQEKETLVNMINMYQANGSVEVFENPFYETRELPSHPAMRFVVVVEQPAGGKELLRSFFSFCSA